MLPVFVPPGWSPVPAGHVRAVARYAAAELCLCATGHPGRDPRPPVPDPLRPVILERERPHAKRAAELAAQTIALEREIYAQRTSMPTGRRRVRVARRVQRGPMAALDEV